MLSVAVIGIEYEINLGYIARIMRNFDLEELLLIDPKCDIDKAKLYATHGSNILDNVKVVDIDYLKRYNQLIGTTAIKGYSKKNLLRQTVKPEDITLINNACILLGRESNGLTNEELALCDNIVTIETGIYNTLNISHALAIILYEFKKKKVESIEIADKMEMELLIDYALRLAKRCGINEYKYNNIVYSLRRLLGMSMPTSREVKLLITLFRKAILAIDRESI